MSPTEIFWAERPRLIQLAYRMLGEVAAAEDVVQDAWVRWARADTDEILAPAAWLTQVTTRLCLDRMKAIRARRETYVGPWLPEPLIEEMADDPVERAEDVSVAFLLALERLSPLERAVFLLHDVFEAGYPAVAEAVGRSEAACRQLAVRARAHIKDARPRFNVPQDQAARLAGVFLDAAMRQDWQALAEVLTEDAVMITDGGGKQKAALRPLIGRDDVLLLLKGLAGRRALPTVESLRAVRINGYPGFILHDSEGDTTYAFQPSADGRIQAVYCVRNPEKLMRLDRSRSAG